MKDVCEFCLFFLFFSFSRSPAWLHCCIWIIRKFSVCANWYLRESVIFNDISFVGYCFWFHSFILMLSTINYQVIRDLDSNWWNFISFKLEIGVERVSRSLNVLKQFHIWKSTEIFCNNLLFSFSLDSRAYLFCFMRSMCTCINAFLVISKLMIADVLTKLARLTITWSY